MDKGHKGGIHCEAFAATRTPESRAASRTYRGFPLAFGRSLCRCIRTRLLCAKRNGTSSEGPLEVSVAHPDFRQHCAKRLLPPVPVADVVVRTHHKDSCDGCSFEAGCNMADSVVGCMKLLVPGLRARLKALHPLFTLATGMSADRDVTPVSVPSPSRDSKYHGSELSPSLQKEHNMTNGVVGDNQESNCDLRDDGTGKVRPELDVHDSAPTRYVPYKVPKVNGP
eukprot:493831-Prorocentrum_minimum.AAC.2